jgi:hypothetical protein
MVRRITEDTLNKMIAMRKSGSTYAEIGNTLGVSKERCLNYLKDVEQTQNETENIDRDTEVKTVLNTYGFTGIINLGTIVSLPFRSPPTYIATRGEESWSIIVIINPANKYPLQVSLVDKYVNGVLIKEGSGWKLIKVTKTIMGNGKQHFESTDVIS